MNTLLGPLLPILAARWRLTDAQSGLLFASQFAGATAANGLSGILGARIGVPNVMALGFAMMGVGVAALGAPWWPAGIAAVLCFGMGFGFAIPASNVAVSELNPGRRAAALNILNFCWCIGAVFAAPGVALFRDRGQLVVPQTIIVALSFWVAVWLIRHAQIVHPPPQDELDAQRGAGGNRGIGLPRILAVLGFLYVGTETSIGGWATSYAQRLSVSGSSDWVIAQSAFWAALLAGRAAAPLALRRLAPETLVLCCLMLSSAGVGAVLVSSGAGSLIAAVVLCGIGLAAVFPTVAGIYTQIQSARSVRSAGMYFVLSSLGGAALPWLVGLISMRTGSLRFGMAVPAAATAAMIALQLVVISRLRAGSKSSRGGPPG